MSDQIQAMQQELHKMAAEKAKFEQQQREVDQQKEQLAQLALELKHRSHDIEDMCLVRMYVMCFRTRCDSSCFIINT